MDETCPWQQVVHSIVVVILLTDFDFVILLPTMRVIQDADGEKCPERISPTMLPPLAESVCKRYLF